MPNRRCIIIVRRRRRRRRRCYEWAVKYQFLYGSQRAAAGLAFSARHAINMVAQTVSSSTRETVDGDYEEFDTCEVSRCKQNKKKKNKFRLFYFFIFHFLRKNKRKDSDFNLCSYRVHRSSLVVRFLYLSYFLPISLKVSRPSLVTL